MSKSASNRPQAERVCNLVPSRGIEKDWGIEQALEASAIAAAPAALRLAREEAYAGKTLVGVLPDSGERYLSSVLFEGVFDEKGLAPPSS